MIDHPQIQHAVSATIGPAAVASAWVHAPEIVTTIAGVLAILWYLVLLAKEAASWKRRWIVKTTTVTKTVQVSPPEAPKVKS